MATPAVGGSPGGVRPAARATGRLGSEEYHSAGLPPAQEAAVLYAANHAAAAANLLKTEIKDAMGRSNKQAWLMLFDLYQIAPNRAEFDSLSMLFTVKFEQSPPAWTEQRRFAQRPAALPEPRAQGLLRAQAQRRRATSPARSRSSCAFAESQGTVRLDLAKIDLDRGPRKPCCSPRRCTACGARKLPMWFNNLEALRESAARRPSTRAPARTSAPTGCCCSSC